MQTYRVTVSRSFEITVDVKAESPQEASSVVNDVDHELPPIEQWSGCDDWRFVTRDPVTYEELYVEE